MAWSLLDRESYFGLTRRRLQTLYIVAAAVMAALVPLILFAGFWIRAEFGKGQRDVEIFLGAQAATLSQRIDGEIDRQISALDALGAVPSLEQDVGTFEESARRAVKQIEHWTGLALIDGRSARVLFSVGEDLGDRIDADRVAATITGKRASIETRPPADGRAGSVLIYVPIVREDAATHVLLLDLDARDIQVVLGKGLPRDLLAIVVDRKDRVLARSLDPDRRIGQPIAGAFKDGIAGRPSGLIEFDSLEGEPMAAAFVRSDLTGWVTATGLGRERHEQLMTRSTWATIAAGALSLALAAILAVFIIHTITERRVSNERLAASRALGELDARLLATSQDALNDQRRAASEREVLLREIYHRVKNNLQIVQSLLRLGSRDLKPGQREPFEDAVRRIGAMARVHTLLYNSPDLASIDFRDYLEELLRELSEGFSAEKRSIESILNAEAMRMPLDTAVPLAFIAVEILTNSFKHAFPDGRSGRITVEVHKEGDTATLRIEDDGVGVSHDPAARRRLGLTMVKKLVQQIGGELEEPAPGSSTFIVRFPLGKPVAATVPPLTSAPAT
ncbi:sensor histidine kinase [Enterovirga rhinocerotis]|uniref:histidine kinase n=1 Tax=Enterovirga rhinocerotis TaxID=1339210 RepID=A0A4V3DYU4_9HYPH|nr:sensor histidine kinase [Enterovirga rhinocerotis]TDR94029.1 two-component sensor histidine kinase [Enterovirga rhinocerotis]